MDDMNAVSRTLYIPLYGKASVSRKGVLLRDPMAEHIWRERGFALRGKSRSRWLAYCMAMRAVVFDRWTAQRLQEDPHAVVLHLGCGLDSRALRVAASRALWIDADLLPVIAEKRRYFQEDDGYRLVAADARETAWVDALPHAGHAVIVLEGLSMYLTHDELIALLAACARHFDRCDVLMDCYTAFAAKASRFKNPVKDVGAGIVSGMDDPRLPERAPGVRFAGELPLTPAELVNELPGGDRAFFRVVLAGPLTARLYRLFAYRTAREEAASCA